MSLRSKVVLVSVGTGAMVAGVLVWAFFVQAREVMTEELRARGRTAAIGLSSNLSYALTAGDALATSSSVQATLEQVPDVAYVVVLDRGGGPLVEAFKPELRLMGFSTADIPSLGPVDLAKNPSVDQVVELRGVMLQAVEVPVLEDTHHARAGKEEALLAPATLQDLMSGPEGPGTRVIGKVQLGMKLGSLQGKVSSITSRAFLVGLLAMVGCALVAYLLARLVTEPVERLTRAAGGIARGDLEQSIHATGNDEIAELAWSFETMTSGLKGMIADLRHASFDVEREAGRILQTSSKQTVVANQQSVAINETRSSANEIARASKTATGYADSVIITAQKSEELTMEGQRVVQQSVDGIERLGDQVAALASEIEALAGRTEKIVEIIGTVKEVAEMSHVLSLNLSIQAAHAGPNRRGFDVVAMEMRKLAALSSVAATEVRTIVQEIQATMEGALKSAREGTRSAADTVWLSQMAGRTITGLADVIRQSSKAAREIADHARRQTTGIEQILGAINEQASAMEASVHGSEQVEDVASNLAELARRLSGMVLRYGHRGASSTSVSISSTNITVSSTNVGGAGRPPPNS
ncbi:MAG TPA: methyl-accepting chemotaxis protein [Myxococcaceae bacterium]